MSSNSSVDYYNSHAEAFIDSSINADVSLLYNEFEKLLKDGSYILDLGCGSGRDSKHFLEKGYKVLSADPSEEMCKQTFLLTYNDVVQQSAEELKYVETFDAVWRAPWRTFLLHLNPKEYCMLPGNMVPRNGCLMMEGCTRIIQRKQL